MFHLDEYVGLPVTHPASFRRYLLDRLIDKVGVGRYHLLDGEADPDQVAQQAGDVLAARPVDVAFVGIGENGHLAFNDPPADFTTERPYLIVTLDDACRRQQVGEGWFASIDDVPARAISMSVRQILKSKEIIAVVPDARKANAVKACVEGPVSPMAPASILQTHAEHDAVSGSGFSGTSYCNHETGYPNAESLRRDDDLSFRNYLTRRREELDDAKTVVVKFDRRPEPVQFLDEYGYHLAFNDRRQLCDKV